MRAEAHDPKVLRHYEGLVFATARRYHPFVELDLEDIQQLLRLAVFKALTHYDAARDDAKPRDEYVFQCVKNRAKDLLKMRRRGELSIEDITTASSDFDRRDAFEQRYLSTDHEQEFGLVDEGQFQLPSTLTRLEVRVVLLLYRDYKQTEAARALGLEKREIERTMRSIRLKLADWRLETEEGAGLELVAA